MPARALLAQLAERFGPAIQRADLPSDDRLFLLVDPGALHAVCGQLFRELKARYVITVGADDRPWSGRYLVAHDFALDGQHLLGSAMALLPADAPRVESITDLVPGASWAEREMRDLVGIEPSGHQDPRRLVLPDGWPDGVHPLRKDYPWDQVPEGYDPARRFAFKEPPDGCTVVPFGPFHPTLDEPAHFRLFVEGERVRGCEYRGFMVHRGIEKLAESVLGYDDIPTLAERICGICGCVHSVAYAQAVEAAASLEIPPRAAWIRTALLELERLHSHLLWLGLACHLIGFDTLFMQAFRIREPVMWMAEKITGNRKTYGLCLVGGVRWDITPEARTELRRVLDELEREWRGLVAAVSGDRNLQARTVGVGVTSPELVRSMGLVGPVARAAGRGHRLPARPPLRLLRAGRVRGDHRTGRRRLGPPDRPAGGGAAVDPDPAPVPGADGAGAAAARRPGPAAAGPDRGLVGGGAAGREPPLRGHRRRQPAAPLAGPGADLPEPPGHPGHDPGPDAGRHAHLARQHRPLLLLHRPAGDGGPLLRRGPHLDRGRAARPGARPASARRR